MAKCKIFLCTLLNRNQCCWGCEKEQECRASKKACQNDPAKCRSVAELEYKSQRGLDILSEKGGSDGG